MLRKTLSRWNFKSTASKVRAKEQVRLKAKEAEEKAQMEREEAELEKRCGVNHNVCVPGWWR